MDNNSSFYLLIKCGYEGIEQLIMPSNEPMVLINEINRIRSQINVIKEKKIQLAKENNIDINDIYKVDEFWGDLYVDGTITNEEFDLSDEDPKSFCIQKWNGNNFNCCCKELNVNVDDSVWLM